VSTDGNMDEKGDVGMGWYIEGAEERGGVGNSSGVGHGGIGSAWGAEGSTRRPESPNSFGFPGGDSIHAKGRANRES